MNRRLKVLIGYYLYLFLVWGAFRYWLRLPAAIEELWFKPVLWLAPLFWIWVSHKGKVKLFEGNWLLALVAGLVLGGFYFWLVRVIGGGSWRVSWESAEVGLVTAVTEEIVFVGVGLPILIKEIKNDSLAMSLTAVSFGLMRLPISIFVYGLNFKNILGAILFSTAVGLMNGFVRTKTRNTLSAIVAHWGLILGLMI